MAKRHSTNGRKVPAVCYVRMSSDRQDASPVQQRAELVKLAQRGGYQIMREYFDDAVSGDRTDRRKDFQRMIADAERGEFKAILCWDQDRFGRFDSIEAGRWIYPLRQAGVCLVTVCQGVIDWSDFASRLVYGVTQEAKHQFLRDLSRNMLRGRIDSAKRGEWLSRPPLGYVVINKRLTLGDPADVAFVRRLFREYLAGCSLRAIALGLNAEGYQTPRGNAWKGETVRVTLSNPAYTGRYVWSERRSGKYHVVAGGEITANVTHGFNDQADAIVIEDNHPAIIDAKTFDAVQSRLEARKTSTTPHRDGGRFLFTGLLKCGKCDGPMYGLESRYRCHNHVEFKNCDMNAVGQDELRGAMLDTIEGRFLQPRIVERLRAILRDELKADVERVDPRKLRRRLAKVDQDLSTARRNMALAGDDDLRRDYESVVRELRQQRERLEASLQNAQKPRRRTLAEQEQRINQALEALSSLRETFEHASVPKQRELLQTAFKMVKTWSEREGRTYRLRRGQIHLRPDMWLPEGADLTSSTRSTR